MANSPGTVITDPTVGTVDWLNPSNATAQDDTPSSMVGAGDSEYLKCTNFGFSIGGSISSIQVSVRWKRNAPVGSANDTNVALFSGSYGNNQATGGAIGDSYETRSYTHSPSDWGFPSLTDTNVNDSGFGVGIACTASTVTVGIDHVTIEVTTGTAAESVQIVQARTVRPNGPPPAVIEW